ncbi:hypothetical protein EJ110_NYTH60402 [Nymphaea thermarum]|nr:hypothetical protein EJ110_NYTH60402 [Nymphaea thermarum]
MRRLEKEFKEGKLLWNIIVGVRSELGRPQRHIESPIQPISEPQYAQLGGGAQTPPRHTLPVDQQTVLLTTLQMLTSLVQTMVSNQRSNASPSGDTSVLVREKATTVSYQQFMAMQPPTSLEVSARRMPYVLKVISPMNAHESCHEYLPDVDVEIHQHHLPAQLVILGLSEFDVIFGMDWLFAHYANIDCKKKQIQLLTDEMQPVDSMLVRPVEQIR